MARTRPKRVGAFTAIPAPARFKVHRVECQVCHKRYDVISSPFAANDTPFVILNEVIHHLLARRWCEEHGIYPHAVANLVSICQLCHGRANRIEDKLWQGDFLGFATEMRRINFPVDRIVEFAALHGFHFEVATL